MVSESIDNPPGIRPPPAGRSADDAARIRARYPKRSTPRWLFLGVAGTLAVVLVSWTVWTGLSKASPPIDGQVTAFETFEDRVDVNVVIQRPDPSIPGRCFVTAQATNFERVGEVWVDAPVSTETKMDFQLAVRTFRRATTATVDRCESGG